MLVNTASSAVLGRVFEMLGCYLELLESRFDKGACRDDDEFNLAARAKRVQEAIRNSPF